MTIEQLIKERQDCNDKIQKLQRKSYKLQEQIKALEPEIDYESYIGKCFYEEYEDSCFFYKIIKVLYQTEPVFITLISNHLGGWNDPGICIELNFDFTYIRSIKLLEETDIEDYQNKVGGAVEHIKDIIYNNETRTPYDN